MPETPSPPMVRTRTKRRRTKQRAMEGQCPRQLALCSNTTQREKLRRDLVFILRTCEASLKCLAKERGYCPSRSAPDTCLAKKMLMQPLQKKPRLRRPIYSRSQSKATTEKQRSSNQWSRDMAQPSSIASIKV